MTVLVQDTKVTVNGDGVNFNFSFSPLAVFQPDTGESHDLLVTIRDVNGVETTVTEGSGSANYSVSVSTYPGTGSITYPADSSTPLPATSSITIKRQLVLEQNARFRAQGGYNPRTLENALDRAMMILLQQQEEIDRVVKASVTDTADLTLPSSTERANKFLAFDATGDVIAATTITTPTVSTFAETFLDDTSGAAVLTTLGVTAFAQTLLDDADAATARATLGAAGLAAANVFTLDQEIIRTGTYGTLTVGSDQVSSWCGRLVFEGHDDAGNDTNYAAVTGQINSAVNGAEDGELLFYTTRSGTSDIRWRMREGFYNTAATGGDQGAGTINLSGGYYLNGKRPGPVLLASAVASGSSELDLTWAGDWRIIQVLLTDILPSSDGSILYVRFSNDGGATFESGASSYGYSTSLSGTTNNSSGGSQGLNRIEIVGSTNTQGNLGSEGLNIEMKLIGSSDAGNRSTISWLGDYANNIGNQTTLWGAGRRLADEVTDGLRFLYSVGNVASGRIDVYGINEL